MDTIIDGMNYSDVELAMLLVRDGYSLYSVENEYGPVDDSFATSISSAKDDAEEYRAACLAEGNPDPQDAHMYVVEYDIEDRKLCGLDDLTEDELEEYVWNSGISLTQTCYFELTESGWKEEGSL